MFVSSIGSVLSLNMLSPFWRFGHPMRKSQPSNSRVGCIFIYFSIESHGCGLWRLVVGCVVRESLSFGLVFMFAPIWV